MKRYVITYAVVALAALAFMAFAWHAVLTEDAGRTLEQREQRVAHILSERNLHNEYLTQPPMDATR